MGILLVAALLASWNLACSEDNTIRHVPFIEVSNTDGVFFHEQFQNKESLNRWVPSKSTKQDTSEDIAQYDGKWSVEIPESSIFSDDYSLALKSIARHHAISVKLTKPFDFKKNKKFVMQYEVKFGNITSCSGAYVKLLMDDPSLSLDQFNDKSNYSIMFGPDKCGGDQKCHFIVRFKNPNSGIVHEHHSKKASEVNQAIFNDQQTHIFRLELSGSNYKVFVDNSVSDSGDMLKDLEPSIIPVPMMDDLNDAKSEDWDDREMIPDEAAVKPADWDENAPMEIVDEHQKKPSYWLDDESALVPDNDAVIPEDYDEEIDGKWEPPLIDNEKCIRGNENICGIWKPRMIANPKYQGKWIRPLIKNPLYKGVWKPKQIENPEYFELDDSVFANYLPIGAIGLELWSMSDNIFFDNFIVADSSIVPDKFMKALWKEKSKSEIPKSSGKIETFMNRAAKQPYLYASIVIAIFLPIIGIIGWIRKGSKKSSLDDAKKTDAVTPDADVHEDSNSSNEAEDEVTASSDKEDNTHRRKPQSETENTNSEEE